MSDDSKPSTSKNHNDKLLKLLDEARDIDLESDDDISLTVRQSREPVSDVRPLVISRSKVKRPEKLLKMWRGIPQPALEDSEDDEEINVIDPYECLNFIDSLRSKEEMDMITRDREERRKYRNDLSLAESMSRALLLQKELRNRHDNSDEGEIDVVNLPPETTWRHRAHRMRFKKQKFPRNLQNIDNHQHNNLMSYRTRRASRNLQNEDEEIDVVNVTPNDIPSSSVAIFNFSPDPSALCRRSYSLHKRLRTCNFNYTRMASPPPMVTIDLLDATIDESSHFDEQLSPDDNDMNIDVIDITDTTANSDVVILEDTADELTPAKQSPILRRIGLGDCPVCLEDFSNKEIMSTICGHVFCAPCIKGVIRANKKCPNCRKSLTLKSIHPLFI